MNKNFCLVPETHRRVWIRDFLMRPFLVSVPVSLLVSVPALISASVAAALVAWWPGGLLEDCLYPVSGNLPQSERFIKPVYMNGFTLLTTAGPHNVKDKRKHTDWVQVNEREPDVFTLDSDWCLWSVSLSDSVFIFCFIWKKVHDGLSCPCPPSPLTVWNWLPLPHLCHTAFPFTCVFKSESVCLLSSPLVPCAPVFCFPVFLWVYLCSRFRLFLDNLFLDSWQPEPFCCLSSICLQFIHILDLKHLRLKSQL